MIDRNSFKNVGRNLDHCEAIYKVRIRYNMPILNENNRLKFLLLVMAELHPQTELAHFVKEQMFIDPACFEGLTSLATIERDCRAMEAKGWFQKEKITA